MLYEPLKKQLRNSCLVQRDFFRAEKMAFNGLRLKHVLEGTTNFVAWKIEMEALFDGNGLVEYINIDVSKLPTSVA